MAGEYYVREERREEGSKIVRVGCSVLGWAAFFLVLVGILVLGYRIYYYSDKLRRGQIVDVPSFTPKLSQAGTSPTISSVYVEPSVLESGDQPTLGNDQDPKLTIVEFGDFQCPYSQEAANIVRSLMTRFAGKVRFIYRDYPIESIHPAAMQASLAAECAREQGKFWPYHDKLYANQQALSLADLSRYGEQVGLDTAKFQSCMIGNRYKAVVEADLETAVTLGLRGTPIFFFNGQKVEGVIPENIFELLINKMIQ
jgi:protein-disulfide isomerase